MNVSILMIYWEDQFCFMVYDVVGTCNLRWNVEVNRLEREWTWREAFFSPAITHWIVKCRNEWRVVKECEIDTESGVC